MRSLRDRDQRMSRSGYLHIIVHLRFGLNRGMHLTVRLFEEAVLEKQDCDHACGNGHIRDIKDGSEEFERFSTPERKPVRVMRIGDDGKIQHVHHLPVQQACISAGESFLNKGAGDMLGERITAFEQAAVKYTVDQIANGPGIHQRGAEKKSQRIPFSGDLAQIPGARDHCHQPKQRQSHLTPVATKFPSVSHALVLDEVKPEPGNAVNDRMLLAYEIMGLDVDLEDLIREQDQESDDEDMPQFQSGWY